MDWSAVYQILMEEAGAPINLRENFVYVMANEDCREYRFQGSLGFGGKLYNERGRLRVSCYPEDETPERRIVIDKTNQRLKGLA